MLPEDKLTTICRFLDPVFWTSGKELNGKVWNNCPELETEVHILLDQLILARRIQERGHQSFSFNASYRLIETSRGA